MRLFLFVISFFSFIFNESGDQKKYESINSVFPLNWKTKMGCASFKSNVIFVNDNLVIGSNGSQFIDYNLFDRESGVYVINNKSGKIINHFANESFGDMDVNGVKYYNGNLYFGNDNDEFLCTTVKGKIIWRNPTSGDIEHEPALINNNGKMQIVYACESGEVKAVDCISGNIIWSYYTPDFKAWKPGHNRLLFKVSTFFMNTGSFYTKPLLEDINNDGVNDLIYLTFDRKIYAISGATGILLWLYDTDKALEYTFFNIGKGDNTLFGFFSAVSDQQFSNNLIFVNNKGKQISNKIINSYTKKDRWYQEMSMSLNFYKHNDKSIYISGPDSLTVIDEQGNYTNYLRAEKFTYTEAFVQNVTSNRNSSESLIGDKLFSFGNEKDCILILNQHDKTNYSKGFIEIFSLSKKQVLLRLELPASSEMQPVISDVNKDGFLDLLINCSDGYLYCYNLKTKS